MLQEYDITEIDGYVCTNNEFRPAHSRPYGLFPSIDKEIEYKFLNGEEMSGEEEDQDDYDESENKLTQKIQALGKDTLKVQFELEQTQLPEDDLISAISARKLKMVHKYLDSKPANPNLEGYRLSDKAKIVKRHNKPTDMPYQYLYDIRFENGFTMEKVSALKLWPCKYNLKIDNSI